jgi:hypothetical protein
MGAGKETRRNSKKRPTAPRSTMPGKGVSNWPRSTLLPLEMRWDSDWSARARKTAAEAAEQAREDANASDIAAAAKTVLQPLTAEHQHLSKIRDARETRGVAQQKLRRRPGSTRGLSPRRWPVCSDRAIDQAKQAAYCASVPPCVGWCLCRANPKCGRRACRASAVGVSPRGTVSRPRPSAWVTR